jgi:hypothetical protein
MKNLLALVGAAIVTFAALGWYLDWYKINTDAAPAGHHNVSIDLNSPKIIKDVHKGVEKGEQELQKVLDKSPSATDPNAPSLSVPATSTERQDPPPPNDVR